MGSSPEASVLDALEQAELAARERRLAASNEAEDIVSTAQRRATGIMAQASQRVDEALDALRRVAEAEADAAIEQLERDATERAAARAVTVEADPAVEHAVAVVVEHVLGRESPAAPREERG